MKSIFKFNTLFRSLLAVTLFSATLLSCSEDIMDDINKDKSHPTDVKAKYILADVITSTAFSNVGGDLNTYSSVYVEHEVGTHNQLYNAEIRQTEPSASTTFNNVWGNLYSSLKNARIIIEKCGTGGSQEGNNTTKGMAEVMAAINSALIADAFGDAPFSEAALTTLQNMTPSVDKQEAIYTSIIKYLDDAIVDLPKGDKHVSGAPGAYDLLYQGNASKWLKLAYGLKARYTMRLINRATILASDMEKVIDCVDKSFASASEQAAFTVYDANNLNPLFDYEWSRDGISASTSMSEKLTARHDPRARRVYFDSSTWEHYLPTDVGFKPAANGNPTQSQYQYTYSVYVFAQTAPTLFLSYHELMFLKAEALCRLGRSGEAEPILKAAVAAAIANTEVAVAAAMNAPTVVSNGGLEDISDDAITPAEAASYFDNNVKPLFDANPLKEVMVQKYIAFWGASGESTECYNDIRRMKALGENFVELANPNKFPLRCPYGADDVLANPNVKAVFGDGQYVYTEPVWWAGGTR